jgi:hypothetical protein
MGITKPSASNPTGGASKTAGPSSQYLKKGGAKKKMKKMGIGGAMGKIGGSPNAGKGMVSPTKTKVGSYKKGGKIGMKKGM